MTEKSMNRMAVAATALGGLAGLGVASVGHPAAGAGLWVLGGVVGWVWVGRIDGGAGSLAELRQKEALGMGVSHETLLAEITDLAERFDTHGGAIRSVVRRLQEHATLVAWVIDSLNRAVTGAREGLEQMGEAMDRVHENADAVRVASDEGSRFVEQTGKSTEGLFRSAETLNRSVEDATTSMSHIYSALAEVQEAVNHVTEASDQTTRFVGQVGEAMGGIRGRIDRSLEVLHRVKGHAAQGREAVGRVGSGIEAIRASSQDMVRSVQGLSTQSREIEGILAIITDVAEETGLLSLNAAILAAQAGEKGAAFGVVADQIRGLATRTRESTKSIAALIRGVQENILAANQGLSTSLGAVEDGLALGREAVEQIELIEQAVGQSVEQSTVIAGEAQRQDEQARAMVTAAGEVNLNLHEVVANLGTGMEELRQVEDLVGSLGALSQSLRAAADEHRAAGWKTSELMTSFAQEVENIHTRIDEQGRAAGDLAGNLDSVAESSDSTREGLDTIHEIVGELVRESDGLREVVTVLRGENEEEEFHETD